MNRPFPDLESRVAHLATTFGITGYAAAVVTPASGPLVFVGGAEASGRAIDAQTPFCVASSGKHATAVAILQLAEAGRIDLHDRLDAVLPEAPAAWADRSIASLLHHTSGLPDYLTVDSIDAVPSTRDAFFACYRHLIPSFDEGEAWCYSNTNYILLGFVIARLTGLSYADALRTRVFDRVDGRGLAAGGPHVPPADDDRDDDRFGRIEGDARGREVLGDGDLVLSAAGAHEWHRVLTTDAVLGADARRRMVEWAPLATGRRVPYGCGWFADSLGGRACFWHAGHFDGWTAFFYVMPSAGAAVYLMTNVALGHTRGQRFIAQTLLEALAPGTTPLSLEPTGRVDDVETSRTRAALVRPEGPPDLDLFAPELRVLAERVAGPRSVLNLWCQEQPSAFERVEQFEHHGQRFARYRLTYASRVEHVVVGHAPDGRIFWAWPV